MFLCRFLKMEGGVELIVLVSGIGCGLDVDLIVEMFGEIEWVVDGDVVWGDLVGLDLEEVECGVFVDGGKCVVDGVEVVGNFYVVDVRDVEMGVVCVLLIVEVDFGVGVEIYVVFWIGKVDVGEVVGNVVCGEIEGVVESDGEVGEVVVDVVVVLEDVLGGEVGLVGYVGVFDVLI